jgi:hypothetical protein
MLIRPKRDKPEKMVIMENDENRFVPLVFMVAPFYGFMVHSSVKTKKIPVDNALFF